MTSADPPREPTYVGFAEAVPDLYEFTSQSGVDVSLHELECVSISYLPLTGVLDLTFDGGPTDLCSARAVNLEFSGAEIYRWDPHGPAAAEDVVASHPRVRGQVGGLVTDRSGGQPTVSFHLSLMDLSVSFSAQVVTCTVIETAPSAT